MANQDFDPELIKRFMEKTDTFVAGGEITDVLNIALKDLEFVELVAKLHASSHHSFKDNGQQFDKYILTFPPLET